MYNNYFRKSSSIDDCQRPKYVSVLYRFKIWSTICERNFYFLLQQLSNKAFTKLLSTFPIYFVAEPQSNPVIPTVPNLY